MNLLDLISLLLAQDIDHKTSLSPLGKVQVVLLSEELGIFRAKVLSQFEVWNSSLLKSLKT